MKIWTFDIETSPHLSFHFGRWQQNIPAQNTIAESAPTCWAGKWYDEDDVYFMSEWEDGFEVMMEGIWEKLDEADVVVGFNSNKFDIKRVNAEFLRLGWTAPSPYQKLDLLTQARKHFAFSSNRLKDLLKELGLSPKLEDNANMKLWMDVYFGDPKAQKRMEEYNIQDVLSTEEFYEYMLGWIDPHPNWGLFIDDDNPVCSNCGSTNVKPHKVRYTKVNKYTQYRCDDCGSYRRGRKSLPRGEGVLA
jgi:DNA polymerase elongation subunit (family B)/rRNA maturation protein Nop10